MQIKTKIRKNYDRIEPRFDTMKYWKVIRNWSKQNYNITISVMDMLFFLSFLPLLWLIKQWAF
jgi:hypothetical protein